MRWLCSAAGKDGTKGTLMLYKNYFIGQRQIEFEWHRPDCQKKVPLDVARSIFNLGKTFEDYLATAEHVQESYPHESIYEESFLEERSQRAERAKSNQATFSNRSST